MTTDQMRWEVIQLSKKPDDAKIRWKFYAGQVADDLLGIIFDLRPYCAYPVCPPDHPRQGVGYLARQLSTDGFLLAAEIALSPHGDALFAPSVQERLTTFHRRLHDFHGIFMPYGDDGWQLDPYDSGEVPDV
jgi:hypothetical protein